jgi:hypothetical protein
VSRIFAPNGSRSGSCLGPKPNRPLGQRTVWADSRPQQSPRDWASSRRKNPWRLGPLLAEINTIEGRRGIAKSRRARTIRVSRNLLGPKLRVRWARCGEVSLRRSAARGGRRRGISAGPTPANPLRTAYLRRTDKQTLRGVAASKPGSSSKHGSY